MAKYRRRTGARTLLPAGFGWIFPKGAKDCGANEWYRHDEHEYRCYHCVVGSRPATEEDDRARRLSVPEGREPGQDVS